MTDASNAPTSVVARVKVGSSSSHAAAGEVTITEATWTEVTDETGAPLGIDGGPIELYFGDLANAANSDTFTFAGDIPALVAAYPAVNVKYPEVTVSVTKDGVAFPLRSATLTVTTANKLDTDLVGAKFYRAGLHVAGQRLVEVALDRRSKDRELIAAIETSQSLAFNITANSVTPVGGVGSGATATYKTEWIMPSCRLFGDGPSPASADVYTEQATLRAYPNSTSQPDDLTIIHTCSLSSLT